MTSFSETAEDRIRSRMRRPDRNILDAILASSWTSHNIPLTDTLSTLGDKRPLITDDERVLAIQGSVRKLIHRDPKDIRCLDLGCLEGGISFAMARLGVRTLGMEARRTNFEKCSLIADYFELPNLSFIQEDVKHISRLRLEPFEVILCCGILYHLDTPFDTIEDLSDLCTDTGLLFLDTHFAPGPGAMDHCRYKNDLGELTCVEFDAEPYWGRWYTEWENEPTDEHHPWAAVSNAKSFWPTHESLIKALYYSGFRQIYELYGVFEIEMEYAAKAEFSRAYFIAMKQ
ncbi:MAG: methyltransferase domain-containing protein [Deltaproteobacteria bacterium]|nr:methyltransferase domain-containing protein [Deltaproteobacteria bacterium]